MGLIKAITGAAGGVLADQWREFFSCTSMSSDVLVRKGEKQTSSRSSNTKGEDNIISNGSIIAVADGQCMIIVDNGKVAEICAESGEFVYDNSTEPTIFYGGLGTGIIESFKNVGKRFTFGGQPARDQRVYYFNTKEIIGNKYGTPSPVPFRVVDTNIGLDIDIAIRCHGEYSYKIVDPMLFYTNVCGNIGEDYTRDTIDSQLKSELMTALQPAFAKISGMGIRYSALPGHTMELSDALNEVLSKKWTELRGVKIHSFGVSLVKASEEDENMIKELQRNAAFRNPTMAAAHLVGAQAQAMQDAAKNEGQGSFMAFAGMNMAQNMGGNTGNLYAMGQGMPQGQNMQQGQGMAQGGGFPQQGMPQQGMPQQGTPQQGTPQQGTPQQGAPAQGAAPAMGWNCSCGAVNKGKFCTECGGKKPEGAPLYQCDKCGWQPADPKNPPKFCQNCGDPFNDGDVK